ncbi:hypothetical protein FGO68_gene14330 [Halteria grandinella]|uniref:Uncharacterized protein n=1 Tax=Halteria grandinella TaxID=5974 RepID=A0A8J8NUP8_HALGN|nr:hypothetical protein FGO68_gene14330 [Halteria grandinella]
MLTAPICLQLITKMRPTFNLFFQYSEQLWLLTLYIINNRPLRPAILFHFLYILPYLLGPIISTHHFLQAQFAPFQPSVTILWVFVAGGLMPGELVCGAGEGARVWVCIVEAAEEVDASDHFQEDRIHRGEGALRLVAVGAVLIFHQPYIYTLLAEQLILAGRALHRVPRLYNHLVAYSAEDEIFDILNIFYILDPVLIKKKIIFFSILSQRVFQIWSTVAVRTIARVLLNAVHYFTIIL